MQSFLDICELLKIAQRLLKDSKFVDLVLQTS